MAGTIKGITIQLGADTTKLTEALKTANRAISATQKELRGVEKALKINPTNIDLLKDKQTLLSSKVMETTNKLTALRAAQEQLDSNGVDKNSEQYQKLQREIHLTEAELDDLNKQTKDFGSVTSQYLGAVGDKFKEVGGKITEVGQSLTTKLTLPLAAVGTAAVKNFAETDKTMQLTNATMGNTEAQAKLLSDAMKDAAANSTFGMNDAATATLNFARAGLDAEQAAAALAPAMNLAAGEGGNLDTVSAGLVATINGFGDSFDQTTQYADVFANACNNSALDVDSLSNAMSVAAPIFSAAGYSVNDAALYMGTMANNGIEAGVAANSLKTGLARLVEPASEGAEWMEKLGIEVTNADGSMKDSVAVQQELHDAFSGLSESEQLAAASAIFGKNQMAPWLALINTAPDDVQSLSDALETEGTTAEMADAMMSGFGGSLEKLKSSADVAMNSLGEALAPTIEKVAEAIQNAVDWFNNLDEDQQQMIATIGLVVAAIGPVLMIVGTVISVIGSIIGAIGSVIGVISTVVGAISSITGAIGPVVSLIAGALSPALIGIAAVVAVVVAAGVLLYKNWDKVKEFAAKLATAIKEKFQAIKDKIVEVFTNIKNTVTEKFNAVKTTITSILDGIKEKFSTAWETIKQVVQLAVNLIGAIFEGLLTIWLAPWEFIWENFGDKITAAWETITSAVQTGIDKVTGFLSGIADTVSEKFEAIRSAVSDKLEAAKKTVSDALEAVRLFFKSKLELVKHNVSEIMEAVRNFFQSKLDAVKNLVSNIMEAVRNFFLTKLNAIKTTVSTILENIRNFFQTKLDAIKNKVSEVMEAVRSFFEEKLGAMKDKAQEILDAVKSKFTDIFDGIQEYLSPIIDWLKGIFNFEWSLPSIKLPHFSIEGEFSLENGTVPHLSVEWYDKGGIFSSPSIIGVGEKRPEFVGALDDLRAIVREESGFGQTNTLLSQMVGLLEQMARSPQGVTVNQTINAQDTSYAQQQRQAARYFKAAAREMV